MKLPSYDFKLSAEFMFGLASVVVGFLAAYLSDLTANPDAEVSFSVGTVIAGITRAAAGYVFSVTPDRE